MLLDSRRKAGFPASALHIDAPPLVHFCLQPINVDTKRFALVLPDNRHA
jgi:hypothetical protein